MSIWTRFEVSRIWAERGLSVGWIWAVLNDIGWVTGRESPPEICAGPSWHCRKTVKCRPFQTTVKSAAMSGMAVGGGGGKTAGGERVFCSTSMKVTLRTSGANLLSFSFIQRNIRIETLVQKNTYCRRCVLVSVFLHRMSASRASHKSGLSGVSVKTPTRSDMFSHCLRRKKSDAIQLQSPSATALRHWAQVSAPWPWRRWADAHLYM